MGCLGCEDFDEGLYRDFFAHILAVQDSSAECGHHGLCLNTYTRIIEDIKAGPVLASLLDKRSGADKTVRWSSFGNPAKGA